MADVDWSKVEKAAGGLTPSEAVLLDSFAVLGRRLGAMEVEAEALRAEIARRQRKALSPDTFRQRLKRTNDALKKAGEAFLLVSRDGRVTLQVSARGENDRSVAEALARGVANATLKATDAPVAPRATPAPPSELSVMFSYAWLNEGPVGQGLHKIQSDFFDELQRQLKFPPEPYRSLPPIRLWRDTYRLERHDQCDPQLDRACEEAFLCLMILSDKYLHSDACQREALFFLDDIGANKPGKHCIIVPMQLERKDVDARYKVNTRLWIVDSEDRELSRAWDKRSPTQRAAYVKLVRDEIFKAAHRYLANTAPPAPVTAVPADDNVPQYIGRRAFDHSPESAVAMKAAQGKLGAVLAVSSEHAQGDDERGVDIVATLAEWARERREPRMTAILGEFGSGKTVACQLLAQRLLQERQQDAGDLPVPLYFDLRKMDRIGEDRPVSLEDMLEAMLRASGETPPSGREAIAYARKTGALVIFDGLDEVTAKLTPDQAVRLYRQLLELVPAESWAGDAQRRREARRKGETADAIHRIEGPRLLVSCRSHYFPTLARQRGFLVGGDREAISSDDDVQTYTMLPFTEKQIRDYLGLRLPPEQAEAAFKLISETHDLREMAERPILLRFIEQSLDQLQAEQAAGRRVNVARLYDVFVDQTLARDEPKHALPLSEKKALLRSLALTLHRDGANEIALAKLDEWFLDAAAARKRLAPVLATTEGLRQSELFLQDLRNASLLVRIGGDSFRYAHTSIREYFLADALFELIAAGAEPTRFDYPVPSRETIRFFLARVEIATASERRDFDRYFPRLLESPSPRGARILAADIWLAADGALPRPQVMDLSGLDFFQRVFRATDGRRLPLQSSLWRGARLDQAEFDFADLTGADFSGASGRMTHWLRCNLNRADFSAADLQGSIWRHLTLDSTNFSNADLRDAEAFDVSGV